MRELFKFEKEVGTDGAKVAGAVGVEESTLKVQLTAEYPLAKIINPVMVEVDQLVDKLEKLIPGDQSAMATQAKADARAAIVKAISEAAA